MEKETVNVNVVSNAPTWPAITFAFTCMCVMFWANCTGRLGEGAQLATGVVQVAFFVLFHMGTSRLSATGNNFGTNMYGIFAGCFTGVGGFCNIAGALCAQFGIPFSGVASSWVFIVSGLLLFGVFPVAFRSSLNDMLMYVTGAIGTLGLGLAGIGVLPLSTYPMFGWILLLCACTGFYSTLAFFLSTVGINCPMGKPLIK